MTFDGFPQATFRFLGELAVHNDRQWFAEHQARTPQFVDYCLEHFTAAWPIAEWLRKST